MHTYTHTVREGFRGYMCWQGVKCHGNKRVPGELLAIKLRYDKSGFFSQENRQKRLQTLLRRTLLLETCSSRTSSSPPPLGKEGISLTSLFLTVLLLTVWLRQRGRKLSNVDLKSPIWRSFSREHFQSFHTLSSSLKDEAQTFGHWLILFNHCPKLKTHFEPLLRN